MNLKYTLTQNTLNTASQDYIARPIDADSHDIDDLLEKMTEAGSTVTRTDLLAAFNLISEAFALVIKQGGTINTDLFKSSFSITGTFDDATEHFDPKRHQLHLKLRPGKALQRALQQVQLHKAAAPERRPHILEVRDSTTHSRNDRITPGGAIQLVGSLLKIEGTDAGVGVFLHATDGSSSHKADVLIQNKPSLVIAQLPDAIPPGSYQLSVGTQYSGAHTLKEPRSTAFDRLLTVS